ncbi:MAG: SGNH/GDSL hydrolase family protein [Deltaproteobacteria bacterium]|nr:SGNH/GDSL hydrolase family protein [Deltaproteobacteria bacterium]
MPATFHPVPAECLDSTRTARPASTEDEGVVTVALLGDSSTQGILLPPTMTYAARLERLLNGAAPPRPYRVVNCSFSGAGTFHLPEQLGHAFAYEPAVVVVYMGDNDEWIHGSYEPTLLRPRYTARLGDVVERCRARGVRPILLTPPSGRPWGFEWAQDMQILTSEVGYTKGAEVIDVEGWIRDQVVPAYYFVADLAHPNSPGHALIATMLAERILRGAPVEPSADGTEVSAASSPPG